MRALALVAFLVLTACGSGDRQGLLAPPAAVATAREAAPFVGTQTPVRSPAVTSAPPALTAAPAVSTPAPTQSPSVPPRTTPQPTEALCGAPANPWAYNFCGRGTTIASPPSNFCNYFNCITSFPGGRGYVVQCSDGTFSKSGGISGSCSGHGGNGRTLYSG